MERLSHDFNLALDESNCGRPERRKFGLRRRTRSAGNLPAAVAVSLIEDGSSSSPPQAPLITQPLTDSDDVQENPIKSTNLKSRQYCQIGNFESDSFNENFSPTRPANARRKRKYKKTPADFVDGKESPPLEILATNTEQNMLPMSLSLQDQSIIQTKQKLTKQERNIFSGKRKWSHRDRGDGCEMRERSFSGGCSSKSLYFNKGYDFKTKKFDLEKIRKDTILQPGKIVLKSPNIDNSKATVNTFSQNRAFPGSSSFNFIYKNSSNKNGTPVFAQFPSSSNSTSMGLTTVFDPVTSRKTKLELTFVPGKLKKSKILNKTHPPSSLRSPLQFEDSNSGMECIGNESSSLSSSDSDGVVTNDSDREGDDELTDWPGIEELKTFNKSLTFKSTKGTGNETPVSNMPPPKRLKKEKLLLKTGWTSSKNRFKKKRAKVDYSSKDEDAMMSDSKTVVDVLDDCVPKDILQPHSSFSSFSDIKDAGMLGASSKGAFYQSFQNCGEKPVDLINLTPRTNFLLQKTSSSDLNLSEKSPQSDHCYSEHSMSTGMYDVREIRAGCRRVHDERPGFLILSAANEQLSRFLQDSCQLELKLPSIQDPIEKEKLQSLANLYSLDLRLEMDRPVLKKTSNTTQAIRVEHTYANFPSDHKRRCYGEELESSDRDSCVSIDDEKPIDSDTNRELTEITLLTGKAVLDPGEID